MGESATAPLTMNTVILAACVLALASGQTFQSFPSGGAQPVGQQPQFVFRPQQQALAQQQQRPAPQQQFRQPAIPQAAPQQQFRQPANAQARPQQLQPAAPQVAPQQFRQPQAPQ